MRVDCELLTSSPTGFAARLGRRCSQTLFVSPPAGEVILTAPITGDVFTRINFPTNTSRSARTHPPHSSFTRSLGSSFLDSKSSHSALRCSGHFCTKFFLNASISSCTVKLHTSKTIQLCQVLRQFVRTGWRGKYVRMHRISRDSFNRDQILTNCFLNPQRFDGDMFESSTTTSEHDGATRTCVHAMSDTTPILCVKLAHHANEPHSFGDSPEAGSAP